MVSKAGANFVSQETYEMIKTGLGAPLTRDVLVYVTHLKGTPMRGDNLFTPLNNLLTYLDEGDRDTERTRDEMVKLVLSERERARATNLPDRILLPVTSI